MSNADTKMPITESRTQLACAIILHMMGRWTASRRILTTLVHQDFQSITEERRSHVHMSRLLWMAHCARGVPGHDKSNRPTTIAELKSATLNELRVTKEDTNAWDHHLQQTMGVMHIADPQRYVQLAMVDAAGQLLTDANRYSEEPAIAWHARGTPIDEAKALSSEPRDFTTNSTGLSRNPFRTLGSRQNESHVMLASALYLIRGYTSMFCRPKYARSYNAARISLNDFYQSYQLTWRLYESRFGRKPIGDYTQAIIDDPLVSDDNPQPTGLAYFIWASFMLYEIMQGNTYNQLSYNIHAERHYRNSKKRIEPILERIFREDRPEEGVESVSAPPMMPRRIGHHQVLKFFTPTVLRALGERARVQARLGYSVSAIVMDLHSLGMALAWDHTLTHRKNVDDSADEDERYPAQRTLDRLKTAALRLENLQYVPYFQRLDIIRGFDPSRDIDDDKHFVKSLPQEMANNLHHPEVGNFASSILAHLGQQLLQLRPRDESKFSDPKWLFEYFDPPAQQEGAGQRHDSVLQQRGRGLYMLSVAKFHTRTEIASTENSASIDSEDLGQDKPFDTIDRMFAYTIRDWLVQSESLPAPIEGMSDSPLVTPYYENLLSGLTDNVDNMVTTQRDVRKVLMRDGYLARRISGDLAESTVFEGVARFAMAPGSDTSCRHAQRDMQAGKLSVLRRWQSYNPRVPHPGRRQVRGGGYLLIWNGRGVAIDPGFDFVANLYDQGYSLDDVDMIVITHAHPDHDDDLIALTSLLNEWNEFQAYSGQTDKTKCLDVVLNHSAYLKHHAWLRASRKDIARILCMSAPAFDPNSKDPLSDPSPGDNATIDLRWMAPRRYEMTSHTMAQSGRGEHYAMSIEVTPAWHHDVIGETDAVGLIFHLYNPSPIGNAAQNTEPVWRIGYTGDSGPYGWRLLGRNDRGRITRTISNVYKDCDVLIAHVGDVRTRELLTNIAISGRAGLHMSRTASSNEGHAEVSDDERTESIDAASHPLTELWKHWILQGRDDQQMPERVREFVFLMLDLKLISEGVLDLDLPTRGGRKRHITIRDWLARFGVSEYGGRRRETEEPSLDRQSVGRAVNTWLQETIDAMPGMDETIRSLLVANATDVTDALLGDIDHMFPLDDAGDQAVGDNQAVNASIVTMCMAVSGMIPWQYEKHLGAFGIHRLLADWAVGSDVGMDKSTSSRSGVFIVGELPEELASYRHKVAEALNAGIAGDGHVNRKVFTGDLGLSVRLPLRNNGRGGSLKVRCQVCDHNNESVLSEVNYHDVSSIAEVPTGRAHFPIAYVCTTHEHHPFTTEDGRYPSLYWYRPELREI